MQLKPGTTLHNESYRIIDTLGRGGFGVTYLAEQVMAKRKVCIKEFFPKDYYKRDSDTGTLTLSSDGFAESMNKFKTKFIKEAQTIAGLDHANIIHIYDVFEENGTAYYVMEYIEGESLSERIKSGGAMSEHDAVVYVKQTASALEYIHSKKIMHLDVKPGNIMVRTKDDHAILIDFGLSKHYDATSGEATSTTPVGVSHGYAPMEQYQDGGVSTFSPETDIYSLGATLYFLVTGNVPPQATVVAEQGLPYLDNLSSNIRNAITKSMSYLRKDRPHTIKDFLALLDSDEPIVAVLADESEKTKVATQKPKIQPAVEQPKPKPKTYLERELEHEQKRSRWWMWCLLLIFIVVGVIAIMGDDVDKESVKSNSEVELKSDANIKPAPNLPPNNEIGYTTSDGKPIVLSESANFGEDISHIYVDERGVIKSSSDITAIPPCAFMNCNTLISITLPDGVTEIGANAFYGCPNLTSIVIPCSVSTIGEKAFSECSQLKYVYCESTTPPAGGESMFLNNAPGRIIYVPIDSYNKYIEADYWRWYKEVIQPYDYTNAYAYHIVEAGDCYAIIAQKYGTTAKKLEDLNPEGDPTRMYIGQLVRVR